MFMRFLKRLHFIVLSESGFESELQERSDPLTIYRRFKDEAGKWKVASVPEGRGIRTSQITGPFFVRVTIDGHQVPKPLHSTTFAEAKKEAGEREKSFEAEAKGISRAEYDALKNQHRTPIKLAVDVYLGQKANKAPKTVLQYRLVLKEFLAAMAEQKVRFLDEISEAVLRQYKRFLERKELSGKTIDTRINIVYFMLKKNDVRTRIPRDEMPIVEEETAVPYDEEQLKKLFAAMDDEEKIRYKFFVGTAAREREVMYASWQDIDFAKKRFHVRSKPDAGFTVKNHECRSVPMPDSLVEMLKKRQANAPHPRWIFVNKLGQPDGHFLKKLKRIARVPGSIAAIAELR